MKIERTDSLQTPPGGGKQKAPNTAGERFREILRNTVQSSSSAHPLSAATALPFAAGTVGRFPTAGRKELIGRADQLLELLERCRSRLSSPEVTLPEAYASMKAVEDSADELTPFVETLPEGDDFRDFLNRLVITASVEAIKFRRGDYL
jgi:hypothetical protein